MSAPAEFTIGEVAAMIGFSPHTLRAWERRHNVLKPQRTPSGQRRYSADDVELLREVITGVVVQGLTLKVAVRAAQGAICINLVERSPEPPSAVEAPREAASAGAQDGHAPWRAVADYMPHLIAILDPEGRIVDANVQLASGAGVLREHLRGMSFVDFTDPYDRAKAVAAFRPPFQRRRGWELNLRLRARQGLFSFDCLPVRAGGQQRLILIGQELGHSAG